MTREEALRRVKGYLTDIIPAENYSEVEEIMKALEPEPCEDVPGINDENIYKCSCGYGWDKSKVVRHHFCPNCGKPVDGSIKIEPKPYKDCISRQYLLDNCVVDKVTMPYVPVSKIENAPPVTPQQKTGRWINNRNGTFECSKCGTKHSKSNYCPNCGQKKER